MWLQPLRNRSHNFTIVLIFSVRTKVCTVYYPLSVCAYSKMKITLWNRIALSVLKIFLSFNRVENCSLFQFNITHWISEISHLWLSNFWVLWACARASALLDTWNAIPRKTLHKRFLAAVVATAFELIYYVIHGCSLFRGNRLDFWLKSRAPTHLDGRAPFLCSCARVHFIIFGNYSLWHHNLFLLFYFILFPKDFVQHFFFLLSIARRVFFVSRSIFQDCVFNVVGAGMHECGHHNKTFVESL